MNSLHRLKSLAFFAFATFACLGSSLAATVETRSVHSNAMEKEIAASVIVPDSYAASQEAYPVIYLLHGFGGNPESWTKRAQIGALADQYRVILVCPDGSDSWYWDAPGDPKYRYETHVASELVSYIDENFRTIRSRNGRAIAGISMGGQGAMYLALRHKDVFGAVGSMSGGLDIRPFPKNWNISKRLGTIEEHPEQWDAFAVINNLSGLKNGELAILIDCGTSDFFLAVNRNVHDALTRQKIDHDYIEGTGGHTWNYWDHSLPYQIFFFHDYFKKAAAPATAAQK